MATAYTSLLGLALPVTGELSGTWGDTVNNSITALLDSAVAGTTTLSADADVTLTTTTGAANQARSAVILWTASNGATTRNITAPAQSKAYVVINAGTGSIVIRGVGPTTGVTVTSGTKALVAWNGSDFVKVASNSINLASEVTGTLPVANGGTSLTTLTANNVILGNGTSAPTFVAPSTSGNVLTSNGTTWQSIAASSSVVQYPQAIKSADYTLVLGDAGYQIFHPATDTAARTFTIPANSSVAFPIGTVVLFVNPAGSQQVTVAITTDTLINMRGVTGSQIVTANNILTALKITATRWMCYFADTDPAPTQFLAVTTNSTPYITTYTWSSAGFGAKYTNPATLPAGAGNSATFSTDGAALAVAHATSPFVTAYPWSSAGFGVKYSDPATLPASNGNGAAFSPSGNALAIAHNNTPYITVYPWSSSGFGVKYSDPATTPTGAGAGVAFSRDGTALAVAHDGTPFVSAYPWSSAGFGTKYADPATLPTGDATFVAFSPAGTEIAVAHQTTPFVSAYPWSSAGFGTKYTNPATLPVGTGNGVAFSPSGAEIAISHNTTPFVSAYPWSSAGFGVKFANPATLLPGYGEQLAFSTTGTELVIPHNITPFVSAYAFSSAGFGTKFANPATLPPGLANSANLVQI
jgi:hypothetical protein